MDQRNSLARKRIEALLDESSFVEIGAHVCSRSTDFNSGEKQEASDGVICGYGSISGKPVYIYAQDREVLSGSIGEMHGKKIAALYDTAMKMGCPVVELLDSSGLRIPEATDAIFALSTIYEKKAKAKGLVPQYTVIFGQVGGGLAILPSLSDFSFMEKEEARLFLTAPDGVEGNKDEAFAKAEAQAKQGNLDFYGTEEEIFDEVRKAFAFLPANNEDAAYQEDVEDSLNRSVEGFFALAPRETLETLSDEGRIFEVKSHFGEGAVTAFISLNGQTVGAVVTNGEPLHWKAVEKMDQFLRFCNSYSIPILTVCDVPGFENCSCNEKHMAKAMASLLSIYGNASVPMVSLVKKAIGSAGAAIGSKGLGVDLVYAYPESEISIMDAKHAADILYPENSASEREEESKKFLAEKSSALAAAKRGYVDDLILPEESRQRIISAFEMLYGKANFDFHKKFGSN